MSITEEEKQAYETWLDNLKAQLNAFQSINRYLDKM